jgi:purine-binding chemotaxis protein CheW
MDMEITQSEEQQSRERNVQQYLTFIIGGEEYAVSLLKVREIVEYEPVTRIPRMPAWVRGVMNLRGSVVPVVDLAIKFGQASSEIGKLTCVVIVEVELDGEATVMGVITDAVSQVIELKPEEIEPPPPFGTRVKADYLLGMARSGKRFCLLLDTDAVLAADELAEVSTTMEALPGEIETSRSADPGVR